MNTHLDISEGEYRRRLGSLRRAIDDVGGLATQRGLAQRYGISPPTMHQAVGRPGFPAPAVVAGEVKLWAVIEVDRWREERQHARAKEATA